MKADHTARVNRWFLPLARAPSDSLVGRRRRQTDCGQIFRGKEGNCADVNRTGGLPTHRTPTWCRNSVEKCGFRSGSTAELDATMATEQRALLEELNTAWIDILREIAIALRMSYAAVWKLDSSRNLLVWKEGFFHQTDDQQRSDELGHLFYSSYASCQFPKGVGFAGHALKYMANSVLWMSGDELETLPNRLQTQTWFLKRAAIQTVVCLPLLSTYVLEMGSPYEVHESEELGKKMKNELFFLLTRRFPAPDVQNSSAAVGATTHQTMETADRYDGQMRETPAMPIHGGVAGPVNYLPQSSSLGLQSYDEALDVGLAFLNPSFGEPGTISGSPMQEFQQYYSAMTPPVELISRQTVDEGIDMLPMLSVEEVVMRESGRNAAMSWAVDESSLSQLEINTFPTWTSMVEPSSSSSSFGAHQLMPRPVYPATSTQVDISIDYPPEIHQTRTPAAHQQQFAGAPIPERRQENQPKRKYPAQHGVGGDSMMGSSRLQNVDDTNISLGMSPEIPVCDQTGYHIPGEDVGPSQPSVEGGGGSDSSTKAQPGESDMQYSGGTPASKESSPETPPPRSEIGIHPRFSPLTKQRRYEKRRSSSLPTNLSDDPASEGTDSKPKLSLVKFGNILQLGNASGQAMGALPQEHDEAAVLHMLAERRRRNKQSENMVKLKAIVPATAKMDKASVLAATIDYIYKLHQQIADLENEVQTLRRQSFL